MLKCRNSAMFFTSDFNCWNAFSQTGVQTKSLFWLSNGLNGALTSASLGKNLCKLCIEPINDFNCFRAFGVFRSSIVCVFLTRGAMPLSPIRYPSHSHSVFANSHFRNFNATLETSNFFNIFSTNAMCSILVPLEAIKVSSMNALAWGNSLRKLSMTFWKSAGIDVSP